MEHQCSRVKSTDSQTLGNTEDYFSGSNHEMLKMSITQTDTKVHGPAFIEVTILIIVIFDFEDSGCNPPLCEFGNI